MVVSKGEKSTNILVVVHDVIMVICYVIGHHRLDLLGNIISWLSFVLLRCHLFSLIPKAEYIYIKADSYIVSVFSSSTRNFIGLLVKFIQDALCIIRQ